MKNDRSVDEATNIQICQTLSSVRQQEMRERVATNQERRSTADDISRRFILDKFQPEMTRQIVQPLIKFSRKSVQLVQSKVVCFLGRVKLLQDVAENFGYLEQLQRA